MMILLILSKIKIIKIESIPHTFLKFHKSGGRWLKGSQSDQKKKHKALPQSSPRTLRKRILNYLCVSLR